jgi:hypothetical protein
MYHAAMNRHAAPLALPLVLLASCDLVNSAKATIVVGGILVSTPEIKLMNQFDVKPQTIATTYVGQRDSITSQDAPKPIKGADVSLQFAGNTVKLMEQTGGGAMDGFYVSDSVRSMSLSFADGQLYTFSALVPGDSITHGGSVKAPTKLTAAALTLSPMPTPIMNVPNVYKHPKMTALSITWPRQTGHYAYVTVFRADPMHPDQPQQVFDSSPKTAEEIIKFVLGDPPTSIMVPGDKFAQDGAYGVLLVTMDNGTPNENTFLGSPLLAGSGVAVILAVGNFMP